MRAVQTVPQQLVFWAIGLLTGFACLFTVAGGAWLAKAANLAGPNPATCTAEQYHQAAYSVVARFSDDFELARGAYPDTVSPIITRLYDTRRDFDTLYTPDCAQEVKATTLASMDACLDALLAFRAQEPDDVVITKMNIAQEKIALSGAALQRFIDQWEQPIRSAPLLPTITP